MNTLPVIPARRSPRRYLAAVASLSAAAALAACSSSGGAGAFAGTDTATNTAARTTTAVTTHATSAAARPGGHTVVHVTGGLTIDAQGDGGFCAYYFPSQRKGFAYSASSTDLPGGRSNAGGWSLQVFNDDGHHLGVLFNTDTGSWTSGPAITGTLHADPNLHHTDFDVQLTKVVGQQHAQLKGSIDCP
jgi:hypothetical protein